MRAILKTIAIAIVLLATSHAFAFQASASTTWDDPQPIDDEFVSSWFPEIGADVTGSVMMTWEATRNPTETGVNAANGSVIVLTEWESDGWSEPSAFQVKDVYNAARPIIVSDGRYVHVIARGLIDRTITGDPIQELAGLYYIRAPANADLGNYHSWSRPLRLSKGAAYWAQIAILPNGELVVVYNELKVSAADSAEPSQTSLFSRRSADDGANWTLPIKISNSNESVARSSLAVSPVDGTLILAWDEGYDNLSGRGETAGIQTAVSTDGGASWSEPHKLGDGETGSHAGGGTVEQGTVATDGESTVLVYRSTESDILLYRTSSDLGTTWSDEEVIPNAVPRHFDAPHHFDRVALAFDAGGQAILAFIGMDEEAPDGLSVVVMSLEDETWSRPEVVASPKGFPEYPRLAVGLGNKLYLTFFVRDQQYNEGEYVIWSVNGESDAPAVAPAQVTPPEIPEADTAGDARPTVPDLAQLPDIPPQQVPISAADSAANPRSTLDNPVISALRLTAISLPVILIIVVAVRRLLSLRI